MVRRLLEFVRELGLERSPVAFRSDQENAIMDVISGVIRRRKAESCPEDSQKYSSQLSGFIQRAGQSVEGQVRVLKNTLEARIGCEFAGSREGELILSWLVEFVSVLLNRYEVSRDGTTAYERLRGRKSKLLGGEFGVWAVKRGSQ